MTEEGPKPTYPSKELSNEALEWIVRLNSGEARKRDRTAFNAWRAQSPAHEAAAVEAEALWRDASDLHADPATGLVRPGRKKTRGVSRRTVIRCIAGVGLGTAGAVWANSAMRPLLADHATGVGELRTVGLPDGTQVQLNARSALNVDYSADRRRIVLLEGQAYFEVARDTARRFEVDVRGTTVSALGTAFDIDSNLAAGRVSVFVTQHSVRVQSRGLASGGIVLSEGRKVFISGAGFIGQPVEQDPAAALSWRTGMLIAENRTLEDVIAALRAYHKGWIVIQDSSVKDLEVNAVLDLRTPDESLDALADGLPIRVRHLSNFLTVISAA